MLCLCSTVLERVGLQSVEFSLAPLFGLPQFTTDMRRKLMTFVVQLAPDLSERLLCTCRSKCATLFV